MNIVQGHFGPAKLEEIFDIARRLNWRVEKRGREGSWTYWFTYMGEDLLDEEELPLFQFMVVDEKGSAAGLLANIHMTRTVYSPKRNRDFQTPIFYKHLSELDEALDKLRK